jgi:hypothetical protein
MTQSAIDKCLDFGIFKSFEYGVYFVKMRTIVFVTLQSYGYHDFA